MKWAAMALLVLSLACDRPVTVEITETNIQVEMLDGQTVSAPMEAMTFRGLENLPTPTPVPETWRGLPVTDEDRCSVYRAADYRYPSSVEAKIVDEMGGIVYGPYTGTHFDSTKETDIEHMVARSEAHDSGLCGADASTRKRFSSDLLNLTLASPRVNRYQKGAKDAAEWLPELNQCWFADRVVKVRAKYDLTIDQEEAEALEEVLSDCTSFEMVVVPTPTP